MSDKKLQNTLDGLREALNIAKLRLKDDDSNQAIDVKALIDYLLSSECITKDTEDFQDEYASSEEYETSDEW